MTTSEAFEALPDAWVAKLFAHMRAYYGSTFDRQWESPGHFTAAQREAHAAAMSRVWTVELAPYATRPECIAAALKSLPEFPPNPGQFRKLCYAAIPEAQAATALPAPRGSSAAPPEVLNATRKVATPSSASGRQWARELRDRERRGPGLTIFQRAAWRECLGLAPEAAA